MEFLSCCFSTSIQDGDDEVHQYTWSRYPSLPKDSIIESNRLIIQRFNDEEDNGVYLCRAVRKDGSEENALKLIASNNYLLGPNPYFSFEKDEAAEKVTVKCRPMANSYYTWKAPDLASDDSTTQIDNDELHLTRTDQSHIFTCKLNTDSEYGPIALDLEVTRELVEQALVKNLNAGGEGESEGEDRPQQPDGDAEQQSDKSNEETPYVEGENNNEETPDAEGENNENSSDDVDIGGSTELDESHNDADIECKPGEQC